MCARSCPRRELSGGPGWGCRGSLTGRRKRLPGSLSGCRRAERRRHGPPRAGLRAESHLTERLWATDRRLSADRTGLSRAERTTEARRAADSGYAGGSMAARRPVCAPMQDEQGRAGPSTGRVEAGAGLQRRRGGVLTVDWRGSEAQPGGTRSSSRAPAGPVHRGDGWRRSEGRVFGRLRAGGPHARCPITARLTRTRQPGSRRPTFAAGRSADRVRTTDGARERVACPCGRFWNG